MYLWNSPVMKFCTVTCSSKCASSAHFSPWCFSCATSVMDTCMRIWHDGFHSAQVHFSEKSLHSQAHCLSQDTNGIHFRPLLMFSHPCICLGVPASNYCWWVRKWMRLLQTGCLWISCLLNGINRLWEFVNKHAMVHEMTPIMTWYSLYNNFRCLIMNLRFFCNPHMHILSQQFSKLLLPTKT